MSLKIVLIAIATIHIQLQSSNQQALSSAPKLTLSPNDPLTPFVGEHILITCEATGVPTPLIEMKEFEKNFEMTKVIQKLGVFGKRWIQKSDEGVYQCRAYSPAGCEIQRIPVFVNEIDSPSVNVTVEPSAFVGSPGDTVRLQCTAQADTPYKIEWRFFPNQFLPSGAKEKNGLLVIQPATQDHTGVFVCSVISRNTKAILVERGVSVTIGSRSSSNTNCTIDTDADEWLQTMKKIDERNKFKEQRKVENSIDQTAHMRGFFSVMHFESVPLSETQQCRLKNAIFNHFHEIAIEVENENPYNTSIYIKKLLKSFSTYYNNSIFTKQEEHNIIRSNELQCSKSRTEACETDKYDIIFELVKENPESEGRLKEWAKYEKYTTATTEYYTLYKFFYFASEISIMFPIERQQQMDRSIHRFLGVLDSEKMREMYDEKAFPNNPENCNGAFFPATGGYLKAAEHFVIQERLLIKFEMKPRNVSGTLMLLHADESYFALQMINGSIKLSANAGLGPFYALFRSRNTNYFLDDCWHTIRVIKSWEAIILQVDEHTQFNADPNGFGSTNFNHSLYIGGYPPELTKAKFAETNEQFVGCVKNLQISTQQYNISSFMTYGNVAHCSCPHI